MPSIAPTLLTAPLPGNKAAPRRGWLWLLALALTLLAATARAAPVLVLDQGHENRSLAGFADILSDPEQALPIQAVLQPDIAQQFRPAEQGDLTLEQAEGVLWLRFTLRNRSAEPAQYILEILPAGLSTSELYRGDQRQPQTQLPGQQIKRSLRLFTLKIPAGESATYHLRLSSPVQQQFSLAVYDYASLISKISYQEITVAIFTGMLLAIIVFTSVRTVLFRDALFAILAAHCLLLILYYGMAWGYIGEAQGLLPPWQDSAMTVLCIVLALCELSYAVLFPLYPQDRPSVWPRVLRSLMGLNVLALLALLIVGGALANAVVMTVLPITAVVLALTALVCFLMTYSRMILCYLATRVAVTLVYLIGMLSYRGELVTIDTINLCLMAASTGAAMIHTALVLARHRQRQRQQSEETQRIAVLGEVSRAKTDVVSRITHDIRTPVSAMLGASELLEETQISDSQRDYLHTLQRASQELVQVLEEAGQSARFNERDVELRQEALHLPELIDESLSSFKNIAAERNLDLICDIAPDLRERVLGDPSRIKQLISHAMNSALDHSESGHILLQVRPGDISAEQIDFEISHQGRPFTQKERNVLNHSAAGEDRRINPRFAIIGQLVSLMGGRVSARSSVQGENVLQFSLFLGLVPEDPASAANRLPELQHRRILVVDNNQTFCDVICKHCDHWGMEVYAAQSEQAALALIRNQLLLEQAIDIILLDYHLSSSTGLSFAQRLAGEVQPSYQPLIMLLAHSNISLEKTALAAANVRRVLAKPLSGTALRGALSAELHFDASKPLSKPQPKQGIKLHCLVAEDNPTNAQVLTGMLAKLGIEVTLVDNGQQAVSTFMRSEYDLVFMDIEMPIMDGVEATRLIRSFERDQRTIHTPIFGLTANALDEQRDIYLKAGMDLHLIKPLRMWELAEAIKRWTDIDLDTP